MSALCEPTLLTSLLSLASWLGDLIRSLFPWPAIVLLAILFAPVRHAIDRIVASLADSIRALRSLKVAGIELNLDPKVAQELAAKSTAVVVANYERKADMEAAHRQIWEKFTTIIDSVVTPLAAPGVGFRATIHIEDQLQSETLYQLVEYQYVIEPAGPGKTRGRRHSIRFGIIGRAWRLSRSDYQGAVTTDVDDLIKTWGMTHAEAVLAGHGRRSFAVILLRDASGGYSGLIFIDAVPQGLFGTHRIETLDARVNAAATASGLSNALAEIKRALAQQYQSAS
jgi:hypothetical protein